ncbi:DUF6481 family protein [Sphingomonas sp. AOB5]|uniref:DUF6481 family protein n=1 Tax=Sphingomonas sp. AOB5 TaxID=3034017 RepID=UPI0023F8B7B1|nr:DUF6481 family protein [Sphingomonas sp. AOB5]MDF7777251.1 DUF6481 family protein [Sphingomonas sp. AOB5]
MAGFKLPSFQDRRTASAEARQKALEKLKAKPAVDPAVLAERTAARLAKEAAEAEKREAKKREKAEAEEAKRIAAEEAAAAALAAELAKRPKVRTAAEMKAARDARYAARKAKQ